MEKQGQPAFFRRLVDRHIKIMIIFIVRINELQAAEAFFCEFMDFPRIRFRIPEIHLCKGNENIRKLLTDLQYPFIRNVVMSADPFSADQA